MTFPKFLRVAIVPKLAIFDVNYTSSEKFIVTGGSDAALLKIMARYLKFQYKLLAPADGGWGRLLNNKTWTGTIGMIVERKADLAIGKIAITEDRSVAADYSYPYDIEILTFATKLPGTVPKAAAFLWPFTWEVWIALFLLIICISFAYHLVLLKRFSMQRLIIGILGSFAQQPLIMRFTTLKIRFLTLGWLFGLILLSMHYNALLLSFLTVPIRIRSVENIQQLVKAVTRGSFRCMTFKGDSHLQVLLRSTQPSLVQVGKTIRKHDWTVKPLKAEVSKVLRDGKTAVLAPSFFFRHQMDGEVFVSKDSFSMLTRAIFFRKDFCCKYLIDKYIHRVWNAGLYHKYLKDQLFKSQFLTRTKEVNDQVEMKPLTVDDLSGAFILLILGYLLSLCVCICEVFHFYICTCKMKSEVKKQKPLLHKRAKTLPLRRN